MTDLLTTVGKKISERWLAVIMLPGVLYVAVTGWALLAGHRHALDLPWLADRLTDLWRQSRASGPGSAVVAAAAILAAAGVTGVAATVTAEDGVQRLWAVHGPLRRLLTLRARTRAAWRGRSPRPPNRYLPRRATLIGERFRLIGARVHVQYGLSVTAAWPRIWMLTSADTRTLISNAYQRYLTDTTLMAWGLLYLPWTMRWWPAVIIATAALTLGYRRVRASSVTLSTLIEATVDAHTTDLAKALGIDLPEGRVTPEEGNRINNILNKRA